MLCRDIQAKMFYVKGDNGRWRYRLWVDDVTLYESEEMVMVTYWWIEHPRPSVIARGVVTQRMHWRGSWGMLEDVYVIQELP